MMWKILPFFAALIIVRFGSSQGRQRDIDVGDPDFQRAQQHAVSEYNSKSQEKHIYAVDKVMKAQIEMEEERVKYTMTTQLGKTFCTKDKHTGYCPIIRNPHYAKFIVCSFTVLKYHGLKLVYSKCIEITQWD